MTLPTLNQLFPGHDDLTKTTTMDAPDDVEAALDRLRSDLERACEEKPDAVARWISDLDNSLHDSLRRYITAIMPSELVTDNNLFLAEYGDGYRAALEDHLSFLQTGNASANTGCMTLRLSNTTLEQTAQDVLDHLTAKRIAEEMDTPTYIERLRGAFKRIRDGARSQGERLAEYQPLATTAAHRIAVLGALITLIEDTALPKLRQEGTEIAQMIADLRGFAERADRFARQVANVVQLNRSSMDRLQNEFAAQTNVAGAEGESIMVSREIERHAIFRMWPLVWALFVTLLVKIVLSYNTSATLHDIAVPILLLTFALTWILSVYIGVWARAARMQTLQSYTRKQLDQVLMSDTREAEVIEFPCLGPDPEIAPYFRLRPFLYRGNTFSQKRFVVARNLLALAIPALLLALVLITRDTRENVFIAQFGSFEPCVLAKGHLVFSTRKTYYVQASGGSDTLGERALNLILPELTANSISRADVIRISDAGPARQPSLRPCIAPAGEQGGGDGGALTVNLGATSLDMLTQVVTNGLMPRPQIASPILVDARTTLALELSKTPDEVDPVILLATLDAIRAEVDINLTRAQALGMVFGAQMNSTSTIEVPERLIAAVEANTDIVTELQFLRAALQASTAEATSSLDFDSTAVAAALATGFSALVEQNESLKTSINVALDARNQGALVIAPIVTPVSNSESANTNPALTAQIFQTSLTLPNTTQPIDTLANTLVLPFFVRPVETGNGELQTAQGAFNWGANPDYLEDPKMLPDGTTYFQRIANTLESCAVGDATVDIDIIGLASRSWEDQRANQAPGMLNYHLAEGRRIGALRKISSLMTTASANRIRVQIADGTYAPMSRIIAQAESAETLLPSFGRFGSEESFATRRDVLLAVTGLSADAVSPLEELFARSVVLRMVKTNGGPCAF